MIETTFTVNSKMEYNKKAMTPETIKIDNVEYVRKDSVKEQSGNVVIVRTVAAGVHVGELSVQPTSTTEPVILRNSRRIWKWSGANTLNELSQKGASGTGTKISEPVPMITLMDAVEIIPCSIDGAKNLQESRWQK